MSSLYFLWDTFCRSSFVKTVRLIQTELRGCFVLGLNVVRYTIYFLALAGVSSVRFLSSAIRVFIKKSFDMTGKRYVLDKTRIKL